MIVFSSVSKSFADKQTAIVDLNLEINEGDLLVITGPSGAGKTTLMKLLIREYKNSEIPALRRKIGVVFQDYKLIEEMNVWENIALPLYISNKKDEEIESRVTDLLNLIGLADKALQFPRQLSGGEAQRVSIARALSVGPKIIFADEPTGNLDSEATIKITRLLKKINELGTTLLFATHDQLVLDELGKGKIIHLDKKEQSEPKKQNESTPEPVGEEKIDEEREKVKEKLDKLAKEETKKEETKPKLSLADRLSFPKLKLKIGSKKIKNNDQKEKSKDKKEEKKKNEST